MENVSVKAKIIAEIEWTRISRTFDESVIFLILSPWTWHWKETKWGAEKKIYVGTIRGIMVLVEAFVRKAAVFGGVWGL